MTNKKLQAGDRVKIKDSLSARTHGVVNETALIVSLEDPQGWGNEDIFDVRLDNYECSLLAKVFTCRGVHKGHLGALV